jgi:hypothetical protein
MEKGKESEFPEGRGGLESATRILMKGSGIRVADSDDRGFPLKISLHRYMKLHVHGFWGGFIEQTDADHVGFFIELFKMVFQENIEIEHDVNHSDILLESIFSESTKLFDKTWKYTFLFSGESRLNQYASHYDCVLWGEHTHKNIVNVPLFVCYLYCNQFLEKMYSTPTIQNEIPKKNICAIITNPAGEERNYFLEKLEKKIHIEYLGRYKNNSPMLHAPYNSYEFRNHIKDYKFIVSMENSRYDTYITEKITHGFLAHTVPIYWGSLNITDYFNRDRFINIESVDDEYIDEKINKIIEMCNDDNEYLKMISQPVFKDNTFIRSMETIATDIQSIIFKY